jgi:hypothetical protein
MVLLCLFLNVVATRHVLILVHPHLLSLSRDYELPRNEGLDLGEHVGHQEGAGETRRCAHQGGDPV